jgi:hypothetical protein
LAAAGAGDEGEPEVLLPVAAGAGMRSGLAMPSAGAIMGLEPAGGGAWLAAAGAGLEGALDVLLPLGAAAGLRSALVFFFGFMALGSEPTGGGDWLAAAGAGLAGEPEVLDCANAMLALPAMTKAVSEWVKTLEIFMGAFEVAARGIV